jgi:carbon-monoxide dehydrogenase medium subunit
MTGVFECSLESGELLTGIEVRRLSPSARWGYYKHCRKTGELAHGIGAFLYDPDRSVCRAVIGATGSKPIVFTDANELFGGKSPEAPLDRGFVERAMTTHGMTDAIEQQIHFACLKRAIAQANRA